MSLIRRTIFRRHVTQELSDYQYLLPIMSLRQRLEEELNGSVDSSWPLRQILSQQEFFDRGTTSGDYPGQQLYWPIPVRSMQSRTDLFAESNCLTDLIHKLHRTQHSQGILLTAGSGAGKTLACRKAFCDCIESSRRPALLKGHTPCWVRIEGRVQTENAIEGLIVRVAGFEISIEQLRSYLRYSPPLLFFFDLNSADVDDAYKVALDLCRFQLEWGRFGHRCVVASRAMPPGDPVRGALLDSSAQAFSEFTLAPLSTEACRQYLRNYRAFEHEVRLKAQLDVPESFTDPKRVDDAIQRLDNLLEHTDTEDGGFVSIPLLLHFTTEVHDREAEVRTVSDLYDRIVEQHLGREEQTYGRRILRALGLTPGTTRHELTLAALTRVALAIRSRESGALYISLEELRTTLQEPSGDWIPDDSFWHKSLVFNKKFDRTFIDEWLLGSSLLKCSGQTVNFLHDSFVFYFCGRHGLTATSATHRKKPTITHIIDRITKRPVLWRGSIGFLGGVLSDEESAELTGKLLLTRPLDGIPNLVLEYSQGAAPVVPLMRILARSHMIDAWQSLQRPQILPGECHAVCLSEGNDVSKRFAQHIQMLHAEQELPFLHLITPVERGWLPSYTHTSPPSQLICLSSDRLDRPVVVFVDTKYDRWCWRRGWEAARRIDGPNRILSDIVNPDTVKLMQLSENRAVFIESNMLTGTDFAVVGVTSSSAFILSSGRLYDRVCRAEAINSDSVVILTNDHNLKVWNPNSNSAPRTIATLSDHITEMAVNGNQVIAGCVTGRVYLCDLSGYEPKELPYFEPKDKYTFNDDRKVNCVAFLSDGEAVAGCANGNLYWWALEPHTLLDYYNHFSEIHFIRGRGTNEVIIATAVEVLLWRRSQPLTRVCLHSARITALEVLHDGSVISGDTNGFVRRTMPGSKFSELFEDADHVGSSFMIHTIRGSHEAEGTFEGTLAQHGAGPTLLALTLDDIVVSSGDDRRISIWSSRLGTNRLRSPHTKCVNRVVGLRNGTFCSIDEEGQGVYWLADRTSTPDVDLYIKKGPVVELTDSRLAIVDQNEFYFKIWTPGDEQIQPGPGHLGEGFCLRLECTAAVALPNAGLATAYADGTVYIWDTCDAELWRIPRSKENPPAIQHKSRVTALAALSDGTTVSGDDSGTLLAFRRGQVIRLHDVEHSVLSIAAVSDSSVLVACQDSPTVWEISLENTSPIPRLRFDDEENAKTLMVLHSGIVACLGTYGTVKWYEHSTGHVENILTAKGRDPICILPSGRIVLTDRIEAIEVVDPSTKHIETLAIGHVVTAVGEREDGEILLGTASGFVVCCQLDTNRVRSADHTEITSLDVSHTVEQKEDTGRLVKQLARLAKDFGINVDASNSDFADEFSRETSAIGDPLFEGLMWIGTCSNELIAVLEDANRLSLRWATDEITPAHLLLAILNAPQSGFKTLLTDLALKRDTIEKLAMKDAPSDWESTLSLSMGRASLNETARDWLDHAASLAIERDDEEVSIEHVLLALLRKSPEQLQVVVDECGVQLSEPRLLGQIEEEIGELSHSFTDTRHSGTSETKLSYLISNQLSEYSPWYLVAIAVCMVRPLELKSNDWPEEIQNHHILLCTLLQILETCCVQGHASKELINVSKQLKRAVNDVDQKKEHAKRTMQLDQSVIHFRVGHVLDLYRQLLAIALAIASRKDHTAINYELERLLKNDLLQPKQAVIQEFVDRIITSSLTKEQVSPEYFDRECKDKPPCLPE